MGYCSIFQHAKPASALGEPFAEEDQQLQRQLSRQQQSPPTIRERLEKEIIIYKDLPHIPTEHDPAHWWCGKTNTLPVLPLRPGFCNTI